MPLLDMSAVLNDPILLDTFGIMRRTEVVDDFGMSQVTAVTAGPIYGVVWPSNENDLKRFPDLQVQAKTITIVTQFALRGEAETQGTEFQPDIVFWNGDNFVVRALDDWSQYAYGFILAIATSIDLVDQPPATGTQPTGYSTGGYNTGGYGR